MDSSIDDIINIIEDETVKTELREIFVNINKTAPEIAKLIADKMQYLPLGEKKEINKESWGMLLNDLLNDLRSEIEVKILSERHLSKDVNAKALYFKLLDILSNITEIKLQGPHGPDGGVGD